MKMNAETQRNAEKRRENEASAVLCDSLRLCVSPVLASNRISRVETMKPQINTDEHGYRGKY